MSMCKYDNVWQRDFATKHIMIGIFALQVAAKAAIATKTVSALLADALNPIGLRIAAILSLAQYLPKVQVMSSQLHAPKHKCASAPTTATIAATTTTPITATKTGAKRPRSYKSYGT